MDARRKSSKYSVFNVEVAFISKCFLEHVTNATSAFEFYFFKVQALQLRAGKKYNI